jgi:tagatose-1,6-bisphosphate aldolase
MLGDLTFCNYLEFHVKVEYSTKDPDVEDKLQLICAKNNAHLSRNAFKIFEDTELAHRFLTMRVYKEGKSEALSKFKACVKAVKDSGMSQSAFCDLALILRTENCHETTRIFCL